MINTSDLKDVFPSLPETTGSYKTIMIEPIALSGERIAVCSIACLSDGKYSIVQTIPANTLSCMYGAQSSVIQALIDGIISHADNWIKNKRPLSEYKPVSPSASCFEAVTINISSIKDLLRAAVQNTASLATPELIESATVHTVDCVNQKDYY